MLALCEAVDLEFAIRRLFVGGSAVVWFSLLRGWTESCALFEIVVDGVRIACRALTSSFFTGPPIVVIVGRVEEKDTTG